MKQTHRNKGIFIMLLALVFGFGGTSLFGIKTKTKIVRKKFRRRGPLKKRRAERRPNIVYDKAIADTDYDAIVWVTQAKYDENIPGEKESTLEKLSEKKWYFRVALFDGKDVKKVFTFPGALLVEKDELRKFRPRLMSILPREENKVWGREFLTVENGWLFKYNLWAEKDRRSGNIETSVDFGKRTPLYISSTRKIDLSFKPYGDKNGNIYFKVKNRSKEGEPPAKPFYKWDARSETVKPLFSTPKPASKPDYGIDIDGPTVTIKDLSISRAIRVDEKIDPLAVNETKMQSPYLGYGTEGYPVSMEDYTIFNEYAQMAIGKVLQLNKLLSTGGEIIFDATVKSDTAFDESEFKDFITGRAEAYENSKDLIRELKKVQREKGAKSILKKWLTNTEFEAILTALKPDTKGGGGIVIDKKRGRVIWDHKGRTETRDGSVVVRWGYYRMLKDKIGKGIGKHHWEDYSEDKEKELRAALTEYVEAMMKEDGLKRAYEQFKAIKDQPSWDIWFERKNDNLLIELLFDYLSSKTESELEQTLSDLGLKRIGLRKLKMIVSVYKNTNLYME